MKRINSIQDIVDWRLCVGCGACSSICKKKNVELINISSIGIRPKMNSDICGGCTDCLTICPGYMIDANGVQNNSNNKLQHDLLVGSYFSTHESFALDPIVRFNGSSGGILTAIASFCLEEEGMDFVLHTGMDPDKPWLNKTVISRSKAELLENAGSRYSTSSPCELLHLIERNNKPCVFIGKPCDVAAVSMARKQNQKLDKNLGLVLSFFCAGTPCVDATIDLVERLKKSLQDIKTLRYRGEGWPGFFRIETMHSEENAKMTYQESWGEMAKRRPFRCHCCPDGLGQLSDITSGDAWNRYDEKDDNPGLSHVIARTSTGDEILKKAGAMGYLSLAPVSLQKIFEAQGLVDRKKTIFGRHLGMKLLGVPTTKFCNFNLFACWLRNNPVAMLKSIIGAQKRIISRGMWRKKSPFK